jgi:hypothetical protein
MKTLLLSLAMVFSAVLFCFTQQLQNPGFEDWENLGTAQEEPVNWSSLKTADALASTAPQVVTRDDGRNGGYCPKLEAKSVFGITANGLLTNGRVHADFNPENGYVFTDENDQQWHTEFNYRPDSLVGWYKYSPSGNDKGKVEIIIHDDIGRLPFTGYESNVIGRARYDITQASSDWLRFSVPFTYFDTRDAEHILVTIACGDSTVSNAGSTLWVDDLELIYNDPTSAVQELTSSVQDAVYVGDGVIKFILDDYDQSEYEIYSLAGSLMQRGKPSEKTLFTATSGLYIIRLKQGETVIQKKIYIY